MRNKCSKPDCPAPKGLCLEHASPDYQKCDNWLGEKTGQSVEKQKEAKKKLMNKLPGLVTDEGVASNFGKLMSYFATLKQEGKTIFKDIFC